MSGSINISGHDFVYRELTQGFLEFRPVASDTSVAMIAEGLWDAKIKGVREVIGTQDNIVILSDDNIQKLLKRLSKLRLEIKNSKKWKIPVFFSETEDWKLVENKSGFERSAYIDFFLKSKLKVEMLGFIPGFIYLQGLSKKLQIPRKKTPVHNPLKNVLAIGGPYAGIYSIPSPAGWNIIGEIPLDLLQLDDRRPVPFSIGDRLIFEQIDRSVFKEITSKKLTIREYDA